MKTNLASSALNPKSGPNRNQTIRTKCMRSTDEYHSFSYSNQIHFLSGCSAGDIQVRAVVIEMKWVTPLREDWWQLIAGAKYVGWSTHHLDNSHHTSPCSHLYWQTAGVCDKKKKKTATATEQCSWKCLIMAVNVFNIMRLLWTEHIIWPIWWSDNDFYILHKGFYDILRCDQANLVISHNYCTNIGLYQSHMSEAKLLHFSIFCTQTRQRHLSS